MTPIDLDRAAHRFEEATDFTVGVEEEFAILDPRTLDLIPRFEQLNAAAGADPCLREAVTGELISSEIEIISGAGEDLRDAIERQRERRRRLFTLADAQGVMLGATGTHPWADYREQPIIDTEHYRRVEQGLKYVAWRNNTFSLHVHVGVRGIDRAVRACDRLRPVLPLLLAISANSPYLDGRDSGLHSARTQSFTKSFPRCGVPDVFGGWGQLGSDLAIAAEGLDAFGRADRDDVLRRAGRADRACAGACVAGGEDDRVLLIAGLRERRAGGLRVAHD